MSMNFNISEDPALVPELGSFSNASYYGKRILAIKTKIWEKNGGSKLFWFKPYEFHTNDN